MATNKPQSVVGSPQEHIPTCDKHTKRIDMFCEDCDESICSKCAKSKHKDHNWETLANAASQRRRGLLTYLADIKEHEIPEFEEKSEEIFTQKRDDENHFNYDVGILHKHFDEVINRLTKIKNSNEEILKANMRKTKEQFKSVEPRLAKNAQLVDILEHIEKSSGTMSDYNLVENYKTFEQLRSDIEDIKFPSPYDGEKIFDMLQETFSIDVFADEVGLFQYGDQPIRILEDCGDNVSYIQSHTSEYVNQISIRGTEKRKFTINPFDVCVCKDGKVFFTDNEHKTICQLLPSGSVSVIANTGLLPLGICQSLDGGLLVSLMAGLEIPVYSEFGYPSPCIVKHLTLTGDIIRRYAYTEEGFQLFYPARLTQNGNSDIVIVNWAFPRGILVVMSSSGQVKFVYRGRNLTDDNPDYHPMENFDPYDVACDSYCNILITDAKSHRIHLLSPSGKFLKFLLTEREVKFPTSLSLYKSKLWVGNTRGLVKVFRCKHMFNLHV